MAEPTLALYAGLSHRAGMGENSGGNFGDLPTYYDDDQTRRIKAYVILQALMETVGRDFIVPPADVDPTEFLAEWREFGDAASVAEPIASGVPGEDPTVGIVGADDPVPSQPPVLDRPDPPADDLEPEVKRVLEASYQAQLRVWGTGTLEAVTDWEELVARSRLLKDRQDWLQNWAEKDQWIQKVHEMEQEYIVPLGDGVVVLGWDPVAKRPTTEIFEPSTYMPVLDEAEAGHFPMRVHLLWEYTEEINGSDVKKVRRMTWELMPRDPLDPRFEPIDLGQRPKYVESDDQWSHSCLFTDTVFLASDFKDVDQPIGGGEVKPIMVNGVMVEANRYPIGLDMIPVVHFPNTLSLSGRHFGRSPLIRVCQLMDEISGTSTDLSLATQWAARPPAAGSGFPPGADAVDLSPGQMVKLSDDGKIFVIDMAGNLTAVGEQEERLLRRLSTIVQVPEWMQGKIGTTTPPAGVAFTQAFVSFIRLMARLRMARDPKHALVGKFAQRIAIQNDDPTLEGTEVYPAEFRPGPFMPQDVQAVADLMIALRGANLVSPETGIRELQAAGLQSGDLESELAAIRAMMFIEAEQLFNATGDEQAVADLLGRTIEPTDGPDETGDVGALNLGG